jgi:hypothetical protein
MLVAVGLCISSRADDERSRIDANFNKICGAAYHQEIKSVIDGLTASEKAEMILFLRDGISQRNPYYSKGQMTDALLELGDDETIAKVAQAFFEKENDTHIFEALHPKIVMATAQALFIEEPFEVLGSDYYYWPRSYEASKWLRSLLSRSPYFSREVNEWAKSWPDEPEPLRQMLRGWWSANKPRFYAGDYAAVQPGPPPPPEVLNPFASPSPQPTSTMPTPVITPKPAPGSRDISPKPAPVAVTPASPSGTPKWPFAIAALALAAAVAALLFRRK